MGGTKHLYFMNKITEPELLVDSHHGIYVPQIFCQTYNDPENFENYEEIKEDMETVAKIGPDGEDYWYIWDDLLNKIVLKGNATLYIHEDLWAMPEDFDPEAEGWD